MLVLEACELITIIRIKIQKRPVEHFIIFLLSLIDFLKINLHFKMRKPKKIEKKRDEHGIVCLSFKCIQTVQIKRANSFHFFKKKREKVLFLI